jgi:hypothetical protein
VVLATGPIPGFVLLARIAGTQPFEAPLVHSPTFGFALWGGTEPERSMFGMAQAALISRNTEGVAESIGSLYDGRSLVGHGARVFFDDLPRDWAAQIAARFLVFGALYLDSSWSRCRMSMTGGELSITADKAPGYPERALRLRRLVKSFSREAGMPLLSFQEGGLGVDVHYGDGVPPAMRTPDTARRGSLSGLPQVTLVGGACFSALPPHYPTLTFMAQSFAVGQALSEHV